MSMTEFYDRKVQEGIDSGKQPQPATPEGERSYFVQWYDDEGDTRETLNLSLEAANKIAREANGWVGGFDDNGQSRTVRSYYTQPTTPHTATEQFYADNLYVRLRTENDTGAEHDQLIAECWELDRAQQIAAMLNSHAALVTHLLTTNEVLGRCAAQFEMLHRPDLADECMAAAKANRAALAGK